MLEGIVQKISSKPGLISMRLCHLNYSTRALDCKYASTQATFVMVLHFFLYLPASMDTRPWLNIYILNSNKSKQNVIAYL
jgi:hypothetical protein